MKKIGTLIVDDEPLARSRLANLLKPLDEFHLFGECRNGAEAIGAIKRLKPDLVFLDIQMPDMDGFDVLLQIPKESLPFVIFVSAYDQFALRAFDVHAVDYLLKPFDNERFGRALEAAEGQIRLRESDQFQNKLIGMMKEFQRDRGAYRSLFEIKKEGRLISISCETVSWLEAAGNYVTLHCGDLEYLYRGTMNALESELDPSLFLRVHRSRIVNRSFVKNVRYLNNDEYRFTMEGGVRLLSGRTYKEKIQTYLNDEARP